MLLVSESVARAALERKESRGGHTRDDYPMTDNDYWGKRNVIVELTTATATSRAPAAAARSPARAGRPPRGAALT
jgi:succinate dehydrogenase/fumarate reductase flavoprotein subunit